MTDPAAVLPPAMNRRTPMFRRMVLALVAAGFSTFALLYCVQPLLPIFTEVFHRSPAEASLAVSVATAALGAAMLVSGFVAERIEPKRMMLASVIAAGVLTLVVAVAPNWPLLLVARALTGLALSGVPAIALAYVGEEVDAESIGLAVGLHIGGNVFGGMAGRLVTGVLADHFGWRAAIGGLGVMGLVSAVLLAIYLPAPRRFRPRRRRVIELVTGFGRPFRDKGLPWLFLESFLCMGAFVTVYNYIGFRLLGPPYNLSQTAVGFIFALYLVGMVSSAWIGDLAGKLGRRKVFWAAVAAMAVGVGLTALAPLPLVILGVAVVTFGFFGAHSTASSWVGRRAGPFRAQATSMFLFFYYLGGSVIGYVGGIGWGVAGWSSVVWLLEADLGLALLVAIGLVFLRPLPENLPAGAQKTGS